MKPPLSSICCDRPDTRLSFRGRNGSHTAAWGMTIDGFQIVVVSLEDSHEILKARLWSTDLGKRGELEKCRLEIHSRAGAGPYGGPVSSVKVSVRMRFLLTSNSTKVATEGIAATAALPDLRVNLIAVGSFDSHLYTPSDDGFERLFAKDIRNVMDIAAM